MKRINTFTISSIRQSGNWSTHYWFEVTVNTYNGEVNEIYSYSTIADAIKSRQKIEYKLLAYNFSNVA